MSDTTTATEKNRPGRQTGFRLKFTITAGKIKEGIKGGFLSGEEKMTIINQRKRSQEEIMKIITENPAKVTDPVFMAGLNYEWLESGTTLKEIVAKPTKDDAEIEVARVDISSHYDSRKADALSFLSRNATKDES